MSSEQLFPEALKHHFFTEASEQVGLQHSTKWISNTILGGKKNEANDEMF